MINIKDKFEISDSTYHYTVGYYTANKWIGNDIIIASRSKHQRVFASEAEVELVKISLTTGEQTILCNDVSNYMGYVVYKNFVYYTTGKEIKKIDTVTGEITVIYKNTLFTDIENPDFFNPEITNDGNFLSVYVRQQNKPTSFIVVDLKNGTAKILFEKSFSDPFPEASHGMICPTDPEIMFFVHEGDTRYITNRLWIYNAKTNEMYNVAKQKLDENGILGDCFGHEAWAPDGKGMYFVKYPVSPVPPKGICYVDIATRDVKLLYSGFPYWHVGSSPDNKYLLADTYEDPCRVVVIDKSDHTETVIDAVNILTYHPGHPHAQMSPDGKTVIYTAVNDNGMVCIKGARLV